MLFQRLGIRVSVNSQAFYKKAILLQYISTAKL